MPEITATHLWTTGKGLNLSERPFSNNAQVKATIEKYAPALADVMDSATALNRQAYSCAEAEAIANLLGNIQGNIDFNSIKFGRPTGENSVWTPCVNCLTWLQPIYGDKGVVSKYKLSDQIVALLHPVQSKQVAAKTLANFPALPGWG